MKDEGAGPPLLAGTLIGIGVGGGLDGVVLHQILRWHNMMPARIPDTDMAGMSANMRKRARPEPRPSSLRGLALPYAGWRFGPRWP